MCAAIVNNFQELSFIIILIASSINFSRPEKNTRDQIRIFMVSWE